jgi:phosphate transport system substrate-binding protein
MVQDQSGNGFDPFGKAALAFVLGCSLIATGVTANAAAKKTLTWVGCGISKKAFMSEIAAAYEKKTGVKIILHGGGATKGIREVSAGKSDLGGSCRQVLENPATLSPESHERRVQMDPVAWDALAVIVHKGNPVQNITLDQLRKVYTGQITNWKQLGGKNAPIELYVRKGKISGVGRTLRELVFYDYNKVFRSPYIHVERSSGPLEQAIEKTAINGLGVTGISSARKRKVKILELNGKEPSYKNIQNGDYLLYRPLFLVTNLADLGNPDVQRFSAYVHSEEGKAVIRRAGTVPYEDGIGLWLKYLDSVHKAQDHGLREISS